MANFATLVLGVDSRQMVKGEKALKDTTREANKTERAVDETGKAFVEAGAKSKASTAAMTAGMKRAAAAAAALLTATLSLGAGIKIIREFETSVSKMGAISGATTSELKAMRDVAKDLGSTTEFSATQAADGLSFLAMAGFNAAESMAAIPAVLDLATASGMGLAEAADTASNIMSGFGINAGDAANVTDVLAAASTRANTNVAQLGAAMSTVAPIAKALGIGIEDTAAAIGVMSDAGIQGERAGTALRGVLASLAGPTTEAERVLKSIGLTIADVDPATNSLSAVMGKLGAAGLTTADAMTVFGREAASGALVMIDGAKRLGEFGDELGRVDGAAADMAATMRDNLGGDIDGLMSALSGLAISLGEAGLTAILRGVVGGLTAVTRGVSAVVDAFGSAVGWIGGFTDVTRQLSDATDNVTIAMGDEIGQANALFTLMGTGTTMTQSAALATLSQAEAHMRSADAKREEASATIALQQAQLTLDYKARIEGLASIREGTDAYYEQQSAIATILNQMGDLKAIQGGINGEYSVAVSEVDRIREAIAGAVNGMVTFDGKVITANELTNRLAAAAGGINFSSAIGGAEALAQRLGVSLSLARQIASTAGTSNITSSQVFDPRSPHYNAAAQASANREAELARLRKSFEDANAAADAAAASALNFSSVTGGGGGSSVAGAAKEAEQKTADYASTMQDAAMTMEEMGVAKAQILIGGIDSVSNAFGDWISNGFKDFKGFAKSIIDTFKNMLSQMIAMAIKNKIMISLGLGGSVAGTAAAAGGAAAGGAGAALGGMGTAFMSGASGLMSGGFAGASAAISGATGALGSFAAAAGAIALPLLAVVGVFTFFKKKTKLLDEGLQGTVKGFDAAIQSFNKTKTTRFWGLSKKISTNVTELDAAQASPLINAIGGIQQSVLAAAQTLGVGTTAFNKFSYDFKLSLKGMTDDEKSKAINAELLKMGDAFASIIPSISSLNELLAVSSERYNLQNRVLELQGKDEELLARVREQQMNATHELNKATLQQVFALEDAAAASQKAADLAANLATIASERLGIQRQIWQLLGDTNSMREDELSNIHESNRGLQNRLYALQDEKEAADAATKAIQDMIDAISPENFATIAGYNLAIGRANSGQSASRVTSAGNTLVSVPQDGGNQNANTSLIAELRALRTEVANFKEESRGLTMNANSDIRKIRINSDKDQAIGIPSTRAEGA